MGMCSIHKAQCVIITAFNRQYRPIVLARTDVTEINVLDISKIDFCCENCILKYFYLVRCHLQ